MTKIEHLLESTEGFITGFDLDESAELFERRYNLLTSKTDIKIEPFTTLEDLLKFTKESQRVYSVDGKYVLNWDPWGVSITDISAAMKAGKTVKYVELDQNGYDNLEAIIIYLRRMAEEYVTLDAYMDAVEETRIDGIDIRVRDQKGKKIFNPITASKLKRVVKLPNRWSVDILARALANGQFKTLATGTGKRVTDIMSEIRDMVIGDAKILMAVNKENNSAVIEYTNQWGKLHVCEVNLALG